MAMLNYCGLNDVYFKKLLKDNKEILKMLIKGICDIDIDLNNIEYENVENIDEVSLKTTRYDIAIKVFNTRIDLESENSRHGDRVYYDNRKIYYLSRLHASSYENVDYNITNKSYVIFLYNFETEYKNLISESYMINTDDNYVYPNLRIYDVSLSKIDKSSNIEIEKLLDLLSSKDIGKYLKSNDNFLKGVANMIITYDKDEILRLQAQKRIDDEIEIRSMKNYAKRVGREEGLAEGRAEGLAEGRTEGRTQGIIETAKNMIELGLSDDIISKSTGLSISEINELKK